MLQLKESLFLKLLWEQAGEEGKKIAAACLGSGIMQGLAVFSVLQGLQQLSEDGLEFSTSYDLYNKRNEKIIAAFQSIVNAMTIAPKTINGERRNRRKNILTPFCA